MQLKSIHFMSLAMLLLYSNLSGAAEPITKRFNADPSPHVFDNTLFVYATDDQSNSGTYWDSTEWRAYSSKDLKNWQDQGSFLNVKVFKWADDNAKAWAPEMAKRNGKYYFYAPVGGDKIGVAVADNPLGPFVDAIGKPLIDKAQDVNAGDEPIDPMVYVAENGETFLYFGTRVPKVVRLNADMVSLAGPILDVEITRSPTNGETKPYGEAPFIHKKDGTYYFTFSTGWPGQIVYATGEHPLGPFTYQGVILDYLEISTNHQAIVEFNGQTWFFYHDKLLPGGDSHKRSITYTQLNYNSQGQIIQLDTAK
ncbi:family 43 glycosylhydrolase [Catenovulum agarivorans]|uniref:family 43 glycosylhydrolase n=1 Tax=Catenovulum agarivorans TaxID=1172192 RepID=UPI00030873C2|nr:family 43 glycosylhydrolase [Catenovulum agarivorans]